MTPPIAATAMLDDLGLRGAMPVGPAFLVGLVPLIALLAWAAIVDWRTRRIPNWLTLSLLFGGLLRGLLGTLGAAGGAGFVLGEALLGATVGLGLGLPLFALGARGAGDAKLYAAAGAWLGWRGVIAAFLIEAVVGMGMVLAQCAASGRMRELLRNTGVLAVTLLNVRRVGVAQARENGGRFTSIDEPMPHAVPFLAAVLLTLAMLSG